ncbi:MAG: glycosyltransferase family 4 protein [Flavobacterium sp.]|nr:glycosyltransferase family 4 protein [Flavobacterium sp.]MBT6881873.1 glycosyltransferase family 4 protein [Flavobacterium sp.]
MKKKLHILFLCGWYPSRVLPNNGDFIQRHAKTVSAMHTVSVLHIISKPRISKTEIEVEKDNDLHTYIAYIKPSKNPFLKLYRFWFAYQALLKEIGGFDIVHLNKLYPFGLLTLHLKKIKKLPYIISEHWTGYHLKEKKSLPWLEQILSKKITANASFVCPVSSDLKNSMLKSGLRGNYQIIPNVVNTTLFKPTLKTSKVFTITHISSLLDKHKNISGMLRVAKQLEDCIDSFQWNFIGGTEDQFKNLIKNLDFKKNQVCFIDHIDHKKVPGFLNASDVFILFSNYENLPCVILEAFSCGVSVIATKVGGIQEFFPNEFGFLIDKKNEQQLLDKIISLYKEPKNQQPIMHQYAIDNFSSEKICDSFTKLYREALN